MADSPSHDRRVFLARALTLGGGAAAALLWDGCSSSSVLSEAELSALLVRNSAVERLGRSYLERHPEENDAARLVALLGESDGAAGDGAARLASKIRDDYREGRLVEIDGWFLSLSEARLCALTVFLA